MASYPSDANWRDLAACQTTPTDVFFPISDKGRAREDADRARAICARCQVRGACLNYAVATGQRHGIWGGLTEDERRALWARRRPPAIREHPAAAELSAVSCLPPRPRPAGVARPRHLAP